MYKHILTIIEHRFGHQSGLYESSGRQSSIFRNCVAFRVYLMISKIWILIEYDYEYRCSSKADICFETIHVVKETTANLFSHKQGWGISKHIKMQLILIHDNYYTLLVLGGSIIFPLLLQRKT